MTCIDIYEQDSLTCKNKNIHSCDFARHTIQYFNKNMKSYSKRPKRSKFQHLTSLSQMAVALHPCLFPFQIVNSCWWYLNQIVDKE